MNEGWILDVDATVKPLFGQQEEARLGYNPTKPGRHSHCYQAMLISSIRMILNVDVQAGNQTAPAYALPGLWGWLESREKKDWPCLLRGDLAWGTEGVMLEAERPERKIPYLFKPRQTQGVLEKKIAYLAKQGQWRRVGDGWEGTEDQIQLQGWTRARRVIVLRRGIKNALLEDRSGESGQAWLSGVEPRKGHVLYEYSVLVTSLRSRDYLMLSQLYRDRAETENVFDELKNQWGWTGYTTQDLQRSQLMARIVALIFNWWNLYSRLALPDKHAEAITTRPMFSHGVARRIKSTNPTLRSLRNAAQRCQYATEGSIRLRSCMMELSGQPQLEKR